MSKQYLSLTSTSDHQISTDEIIAASDSLNDGKSSGDNLICYEILEALSEIFVELSGALYNKCPRTYPLSMEQ